MKSLYKEQTDFLRIQPSRDVIQRVLGDSHFHTVRECSETMVNVQND